MTLRPTGLPVAAVTVVCSGGKGLPKPAIKILWNPPNRGLGNERLPSEGGYKGIDMGKKAKKKWEEITVSPDRVMERIEPGMSIFIGTGVAEPKTLVKHLMASEAPNLRDLELIQVVSLGDAISLEELHSQKYRLKTFFSGWVASEAITE